MSIQLGYSLFQKKIYFPCHLIYTSLVIGDILRWQSKYILGVSLDGLRGAVRESLFDKCEDELCLPVSFFHTIFFEN